MIDPKFTVLRILLASNLRRDRKYLMIRHSHY